MGTVAEFKDSKLLKTTGNSKFNFPSTPTRLTLCVQTQKTIKLKN